MKTQGKRGVGEAIVIAAAVEVVVQIISSLFDEWRKRRREREERQACAIEITASTTS